MRANVPYLSPQLLRSRIGKICVAIIGNTAAEMLETFGMHKGGNQYRRLVAAFERVFGATIFFKTDSLLGAAKVIHTARFNFFREAQI